MNPITSQQFPRNWVMTPADLKQWRRAAGLSQPALAALLGVDIATVWRWENSRTPIHALLPLALKGLVSEPPLDGDEPPNKCSGCDGSGANDDPENPGERVECDICWGEGDEERHKHNVEYQDYLADLADAQSY